MYAAYCYCNAYRKSLQAVLPYTLKRLYALIRLRFLFINIIYVIYLHAHFVNALAIPEILPTFWLSVISSICRPSRGLQLSRPGKRATVSSPVCEVVAARPTSAVSSPIFAVVAARLACIIQQSSFCSCHSPASLQQSAVQFLQLSQPGERTATSNLVSAVVTARSTSQ
jgi:hypothetical protein